MTTRQALIRVRRVPGAPVVSVRVWMPGGSRVEERPGQAIVAGRMLGEGTAARSWRRISREAEELGCSISATGGYSVQSVALEGLATDWPTLVEWASELTQRSSFPEERCELLRRQAQAELTSLGDLADVRTGWAFLDQLYPDHPLGRSVLGTHKGLSEVGSESCRGFHKRCLGRGLLITVAGDIDPDPVERRLREAFSIDESRPVVVPDVGDSAAAHDLERRLLIPSADQAHVFLGAQTVRRTDPEFDAVRVLGVVLGAGGHLVGRIPQRIRESDGLAYACDVSSVAGAGVDRGRFIVSLATSSDKVERSIAAIREEIDRVRGDGPSAREAEEALSYLRGREPFRRETAGQWSMLELEGLLLGLPLESEAWSLESLDAVTPCAVQQAAARFLDPARTVVTVGSPS